jgi:apolipoprotein N-acyltransferase
LARLGGAALVLFVSGIYGRYRLGQQEDFRPGPTIVLIQTNVEQSLKLNNYEEALKQLLKLTNEARRLHADLVIWPETSFPYAYGDIAADVGDEEIDRLWKQRRQRKVNIPQEPIRAESGRELREALGLAREDLRRVAENVRKLLLVGTLRYDFRPGFLEQYNSSVLFVPDVGPVGSYDKIHLVPFGEYLPLAESFPFLHFLLPYESPLESLDAAREPQPIHYQQLHLAPMICFEDTVPYIARGFMRQATPERPIEILVNQTNDGWFQGSVEADYHLAASIFRSVEARRPMVRVSNTGITGMIDGNGVIQKLLTDDAGRTKLFDGNLLVTVPLDGRDSYYVVAGDWIAQLSLAVCVAGLAASMFRQLGRMANRHENQVEAASE